MTMHRRCQVFRGQSSDSSELLFSVKKSEILQSGVIILDVFLANNKKESERDFRVTISSDKSSCTVFAGESPTVVATVCTLTIHKYFNSNVGEFLHWYQILLQKRKKIKTKLYYANYQNRGSN